MRRLGIFVGVAAMLLTLMTAPLYHSHDRDDHGSPISLVHAHFEDSAGHSDDSNVAVESEPSQHHGRWIEFFTFNAPPQSVELFVEFVDFLPVPALKVQEKVVILDAPRSHGPPDTRSSVPRSPPTT